MNHDRVMLLIDADNVSLDVIEQAVPWVHKHYGGPHVRRAYCTAESAVKHQGAFKRLSIRPMVNLATGKNSTDIALALDAMDLAMSERPDIAVIVSSDSDFAPLYFQNPEALTREIRDEIRRGGLSALCLVLQLPEAPFPGVTGLAPLIGLDGDLEPGGENNDVPIRELSFVSTDGVGFEVDLRFNFLFALQLTRRP